MRTFSCMLVVPLAEARWERAEAARRRLAACRLGWAAGKGADGRRVTCGAGPGRGRLRQFRGGGRVQPGGQACAGAGVEVVVVGEVLGEENRHLLVGVAGPAAAQVGATAG